MGEEVNAQEVERMHFNSAATGMGRKDLAPVCKAGTENVAEKSDLEGDKVFAEIPELMGSTRQELLSADAYSLIYISGGVITEAEVVMLTALKKQLSPQVEEHAIDLKWMWMNLFVERKFRDVFDPPALPSAVILHPQAEPRFVLAPHLEKEGDPAPVDEDIW